MEKARTSWDEWGQVDPLWAIVTCEGKEFGTWDLDEFFQTGKATIDSLWSTASEHGIPRAVGQGLDFGCGVGRLTRALGERVEHVIGLDVAPSMIHLARDYNAGHDNLTFLVHEGTDLRRFASDQFDVICCLLVLQHLPSERDIRTYVEEFVRVLAPGGVVLLQLPEKVPETPRPKGLLPFLRPRTRLGYGLRRIGVSSRFLYRHLNWKPEMTMRAVDRDTVSRAVTRNGGRIVHDSDPMIGPPGVHNVYYVITCD